MVRLFVCDEINVRCPRPPQLEDHPDLPLRIRGALGQALAARGPTVPHRLDPFARPRSYEVLFDDLPDNAGRPFAIDVDVTAGAVHIRVALFGDAGFYILDVRNALVDALSGGIALRLNGRQRVGLEPIACHQRRVVLGDPPDTCRDAVLLLRTPLVVRTGRRLSLSPTAVVQGAYERMKGLAPWHGVALADKTAPTIDPKHIWAEDELTVRTARFSRRQPDVPIEVTGVLGRIHIKNPGPLLPYLTLGANTHIGSHAALGFGRYDLALYP